MSATSASKTDPAHDLGVHIAEIKDGDGCGMRGNVESGTAGPAQPNQDQRQQNQQEQQAIMSRSGQSGDLWKPGDAPNQALQ